MRSSKDSKEDLGKLLVKGDLLWCTPTVNILMHPYEYIKVLL